MKVIFSERNIVVILFVLVLLTFSVAQEQTRGMESIYSGPRQPGQTVSIISQATVQVAGPAARRLN